MEIKKSYKSRFRHLHQLVVALQFVYLEAGVEKQDCWYKKVKAGVSAFALN